MENLIQIFSELDDPRDTRGKKYPLCEIMLLAVYGILCGYEDFTNMAYFLKKREPFLIEEFNLTNGVPSHDTFSDVFRVIDPHKFMELFIEWTKSIVAAKLGDEEKQIAIDGKASRGATDRVNNGNIPYVVSAFMTDIGISIGQVKVDDKSNEITAIPDLLELIDLKNATVTIDAIGTQKNIAKKIIDRKGHYCLQLKKNRRVLFNDVEDYFDYALNDEDEMKNMGEYCSTEKNHGRVEKRKYYITSNISFIDKKDMLPGLKCIGMAILERTVNGKTSIEKHYHLLSRECDASKYASYARNHWQIENNLHWVLDVIFDEDRCTSKKDKAIENISIIRKIVFNLTKMDDELGKKTTKKKIIDIQYDIEVFKRLIFKTFPEKC